MAVSPTVTAAMIFNTSLFVTNPPKLPLKPEIDLEDVVGAAASVESTPTFVVAAVVFAVVASFETAGTDTEDDRDAVPDVNPDAVPEVDSVMPRDEKTTRSVIERSKKKVQGAKYLPTAQF